MSSQINLLMRLIGCTIFLLPVASRNMASAQSNGWSVELPQSYNQADELKLKPRAEPNSSMIKNHAASAIRGPLAQDALFDDTKDDSAAPYQQSHRMNLPPISHNFSPPKSSEPISASPFNISVGHTNRWIPYPTQPETQVQPSDTNNNIDLGTINLIAQDPRQQHPLDLVGQNPIALSRLADLIPNTLHNYLTLDSIARVVNANRIQKPQLNAAISRPDVFAETFAKQLDALRRAHAPLFDSNLLHTLQQQESIRRQASGAQIVIPSKGILRPFASNIKRKSTEHPKAANKVSNNDLDIAAERSDRKDPYLASFSSAPAFYDIGHSVPTEGRSSKLIGDESHIDQFFAASSPRYSSSYMMPLHYASYPEPFAHKLAVRHGGLEKSVLLPILIGIGAALISFLIISNLFLSIPLLAMTLFSFFNTNQMMTMPNFMPQPPNNNSNQNANGKKRRRRRDLAALQAEINILDSLDKLKWS